VEESMKKQIITFSPQDCTIKKSKNLPKYKNLIYFLTSQADLANVLDLQLLAADEIVQSCVLISA